MRMSDEYSMLVLSGKEKIEMAKKEENGSKGSKKPQNPGKFSKGFQQGTNHVQFYFWGTKKIVLKTAIVKG